MANGHRLHMRAEYLRCRTLGHAWDDFIPHGVRPRWGHLQTWRCVRCGTERHDVINAIGTLGQRHYVYPEGYQLAADERPTRDTCRVELGKVLQREARARINRRKLRAV
jgi:hypothetical protein